MTWDLLVVGAGPAGSATALGALTAEPGLRVAMLDRSSFPRDKSCGDGVAPHVVDLLGQVGVTGLLDDWTPVPRLRLTRGAVCADRPLARPTWVVPRTVLDQRLVDAARAAGATLLRRRVTRVERRGDLLHVDGGESAPVLAGADGAQSAVRRALGAGSGPMAVAIRGYAPVAPGRASVQVIAFDADEPAGRPAYAWSFDRGDGLANVGYGVLLDRGARPTRAGMLGRLARLLPGATADATDWLGHRLPLSSGRWRPSPGPVVLAGDAAGLVNPMTGEGIYYAVATGLAAGRAAAAALRAGDPASAGRAYRREVAPLLDRHLRHVALAARLCRLGPVVEAGLTASARDRRVFDDLVELGLASGHLTGAVVRGLAGGLASRYRPGGRQGRTMPGIDRGLE